MSRGDPPRSRDGRCTRGDGASDFRPPDGIVAFLAERWGWEGEEIRVRPLAGDASDRRYYRLEPGASARRREGPPSCVLMRLQHPWSPSEGRSELPFVNIARYLGEKGVPVPEILVDESRRGFLLLEDLGDETLETRLQGCDAGERRRWYEEAVEILLRMQGVGPPGSTPPCYALRYAFDEETFLGELRFFREHALEGLAAEPLSPSCRREMDEQFRRLCRCVADLPRVFTHRDYHARNLMVRPVGLAVLDFQDARLGPVTYDLASLLRDSYVALEERERTDLVAYYVAGAREAGMNLPESGDFERALHLTALQRNLKAIGTFAYQSVIKGVGRYLRYIPNTLDSVRAVLDAEPELRPLGETLLPSLEALSSAVERRK